MELISWLQVSENVVAAEKASNFVITLFVIGYFITKEGCYLAAFLFDLILTTSSLLDSLSEPQYCLVPVFIYSVLCWHVIAKRGKISTMVAIGLLIIFNLWMFIDASFNPETETYIYSNHTSIVVTLYVLLFITLLPRKRLRLIMGRITRAVGGVFRYSDAFAFICYNYKIKTKQEDQK